MNIESSIKLWIESKLSEPISFLGHVPPCPYAREALLKQKITIVKSSPAHVFQNVEEQLQNFNSYQQTEIVVVAVEDWSACPPQQTTQFARSMREKYFKNDLWLLYDHPLLVENVQGFEFNHGSLLLFMIQKLSRLIKTSEELEKIGYYKNWPIDYFDEVVGLRRKYFDRLKLASTESHP